MTTTTNTSTTDRPSTGNGQMLALVNTPAGPDPAALRTVPEPVAAPDEAIVAVHAFSLNRGELALLANRPEGWRPGQDIAGMVATPAADGSGPRAGTHVVGLVEGAGWAQRVAVSVSRLATLPDRVSFAAAATLPMAGLTALRTLRLGGALLGRRVLVTGATGGVGTFAVQLARHAGARVTGVRTAAQSPDEMFDLILESVGGASLTAAMRRIAPDGTIVVFGNSSNEDASLNLYQFFGHEGARMQTFFSYASGTPESVGADLDLLVSLTIDGALVPQIGAELNWRDLGQVVSTLRDRKITGKAVLHVD